MKKTGFLIIIATIFLSVNGCDKEIESSDITGSLVSHSACKSNVVASALRVSEQPLPDTLSRIKYSYDATKGILYLTHENAGFNCCPDSLWCNISADDNKITIQECEKEAMCNCNCLFDLYVEIKGIKKSVYEISFDEPYVKGTKMPAIKFTIDLTKETNGRFSVVRKNYPWGINSLL